MRIKQSEEERKAKWNAYMKEYYQKNKKKMNERAKQYIGTYYAKNKRIALELKGSCCIVCGYTYNGENERAFDFHHVDPEKKEIKWGMAQRGRGEMLKELDKCVLLCANCHRLLHAGVIELPDA